MWCDHTAVAKWAPINRWNYHLIWRLTWRLFHPVSRMQMRGLWMVTVTICVGSSLRPRRAMSGAWISCSSHQTLTLLSFVWDPSTSKRGRSDIIRQQWSLSDLTSWTVYCVLYLLMSQGRRFYLVHFQERLKTSPVILHFFTSHR